jgi:ankyrin repeat protein
MDRQWQSMEDLQSMKRKRSEMTSQEQEFVEAAMANRHDSTQASLPRLKTLLKRKPSLIKTAGPAALATAIQGRETQDIVRFLVDQGARFEFAKDNISPLHGAAWDMAHGHWTIENLRVVFEAGLADASGVAVEPPHGGLASHRTLLHIIATFGHPDLAELCLKHGASSTIELKLGEYGQTALQRATKAYHWADRRREVARILLDRGAYYDIFSACSLDDDRRVRELLDENPSAIDERLTAGRTPLHWAAAAGATKCAAILIDAGSDVDARSSGNKTPLHSAAAPIQNVLMGWPYPDTVAVATLLIDSGADMNAQDDKGRTPLHWAAYEGTVEVAELLIERGAKTQLKNKKGKTALEVARKACRHLKPESRQVKKKTGKKKKRGRQ